MGRFHQLAVVLYFCLYCLLIDVVTAERNVWIIVDWAVSIPGSLSALLSYKLTILLD